jgi:SAM-dependent methyltransferase
MSLGVWFAHLPGWLSHRLYPILRYTNLMRAIEMRHLAPWVRNVEGWRVLDVGCGYGFYSLDFARRGARLIGCDLSLTALEASLQTGQGLGLDGRTAYMAADGSLLPMASEGFDLIFCNCVLEHIDDDRLALAEMHRTLRPGGLLYLTVDSAEHNLILGFLEHLPPGLKGFLLRPEVAGAPTVAQGLDDYLADIYDVRRRYRRQDLDAALRGVDPRHGLSRVVHMITSFVLYPFVVVVDSFRRTRGYGLMFTARKGQAT